MRVRPAAGRGLRLLEMQVLPGVVRPIVDEGHDVLRGGAGEKNFGDAGFFQGGDVGFGNDAAEKHRDVVHALFVEKFISCGQSVLCAPDRIERPMTSTSSWTAAEAIISGVWRRPV